MKRLVTLATLLPLVAVAGCATKGDIEQLRQEIAGVKATAEQADRKATAAEAASASAAAEAKQAADEAQIAGEKADRIFREGLRK